MWLQDLQNSIAKLMDTRIHKPHVRLPMKWFKVLNGCRLPHFLSPGEARYIFYFKAGHYSILPLNEHYPTKHPFKRWWGVFSVFVSRSSLLLVPMSHCSPFVVYIISKKREQYFINHCLATWKNQFFGYSFCWRALLENCLYLFFLFL